MIGSDAIRRRQGHHRDIDGVYNSFKLSNVSTEPKPTSVSANGEQIADRLGTKTSAFATNGLTRIDDGTAMREATSAPTITTTRTWAVDVEGSLGI